MSSPAEPGKAQAAVELKADEDAEVVLEAGEKILRLVWKKGEADRRRVVPAGSWTLLAYRIIRGPFHISGSGDTKRLVLAKGETLALGLSPQVKLDLRVITVGKTARIMAQVRGAFRYGVSIYREGKRIPLPYRYLNHRGEKATEGGSLEYG